MTARDRAIGAVCGTIAYLCWGVVALYFGLLDDRGVAPLPLLAHRVIWSVVFCLIILAAMRRHRELFRVFADPKRMLALFLSSILIAINWLAFIYAVSEHRLTEASLGYYILPLVSVVLGLVVLREKLNRVQWLCVTLASIGVVIIVYQGQRVPWIGIAVALSFGFYGLLRKMTPVGPIIGLAVETIILLPVALVYVGATEIRASYDPVTYLLLMLAGAITASLLILYARAAQSLKLSTLGFMQYIAPTIQLLVAMYVRPEEQNLLGFIPIWVALAIFSVHVAIRSRAEARIAKMPPGPADSSTVRAGDS